MAAVCSRPINIPGSFASTVSLEQETIGYAEDLAEPGSSPVKRKLSDCSQTSYTPSPASPQVSFSSSSGSDTAEDEECDTQVSQITSEDFEKFKDKTENRIKTIIDIGIALGSTKQEMSGLLKLQKSFSILNVSEPEDIERLFNDFLALNEEISQHIHLSVQAEENRLNKILQIHDRLEALKNYESSYAKNPDLKKEIENIDLHFKFIIKSNRVFLIKTENFNIQIESLNVEITELHKKINDVVFKRLISIKPSPIQKSLKHKIHEKIKISAVPLRFSKKPGKK